eukprot:TRINITY_DN781970_c0_g1_i1.p1 TRINITY_DN781970_c0_g1~~TRINITY_DN781970_c0_g1_i1.p1  ORF type:complete len:187 (-),score=61.31 TRINITY_DN781970_c0_g1_i1:250-762(-)
MPFRKQRNVSDRSNESVEDEIRVGAGRFTVRRCISTAIAKLESMDTIVVKGMGKAVSNAVSVSDVVRRRLDGIHQITKLKLIEVVDSFENPETEETREVIRKIPAVEITLSKTELDISDEGYQAPIDFELAPVEREERTETRGRNNGRGRGRGGRRGRRRRDTPEGDAQE